MPITGTITGPTRATIAGLLVAAVCVVSINFFRDDELGFSLVVTAVILAAAAAAWRFAVPGHVLAGLVGLLLFLLFGGYFIATIVSGMDGTAEYNETAALVIDGVLTVAAATTVYGAVSYLLQRRRSRQDHSTTV